MTSTTCSLSEIIAHANQASELLLSMRLQDSVRVSRSVLDQILPLVQEKQAQHIDPNNMMGDGSASASSSCLSISLRELPQSIKTTLHAQQHRELDYFLPCQAVAVIQFKDDLAFFSLEECYSTVVSSLLYNLAMSHHLQGLKCGNTRVFRKALALYSMACERLQAQEQDYSTNTAVLHLAVLHNTMHICSHFILNVTAVESCVAQSMYVLSQAHADAHQNKSNHNDEDTSRLSFFLRNIRLCQSCANMAIAPAA